jgi:Trypsin-like peptidase domain
MLARHWIAPSAVVFACIGVAANATGGVDPWSHPDAVCNRSAPGSGNNELDDLYDRRRSAVFRVIVTGPDGRPRPNGTATLVDSSGIFLTAAHVVHFNEQFPIAVSRTDIEDRRTVERVYPVTVMSTTDDWKKQDLVLLKAAPQSWDNPSIEPVPFRIDAISTPVNGFFVGHAIGLDTIVHGDFSIAFGDGKSAEMEYRGTVFPHGSGSLLLDIHGRAFAMVVRDGETANIRLVDLTTEKLRRIAWERNVFFGFPLQSGVPKIKPLPSSTTAVELIANLRNRGVNDQFLRGLRLSVKTPIDTIHLIDTLFSEGIWQRATIENRVDLIDQVFPLAQTMCTHLYWAKQLSIGLSAGVITSTPINDVSFDKSNDVSFDKSNVVPSQERTQRSQLPQTPQSAPADESRARTPPRSDLDKLIDQLETKSPKATQDLGALFLEGAFASSTIGEPDSVPTYARAALAFLRSSANQPAIDSAVKARIKNRSYAAIMANLALAEDVGAKYGIGSKENARIAVDNATSLGGSPAALPTGGAIRSR